MNQAMISKQYQRICNNPNLLVSKTLKAKYCPNENPHSHKPKKHASWIWKSIMDHNTPMLKQGIWKIGNGQNIPLTHPYQFRPKLDAPPPLLDQTTRVADLIHQDSLSWKADLINKLYDKKLRASILSIPLPKFPNQNNIDKIIWPHSSNGEFQVKRAYELLHQAQLLNISTPIIGTQSQNFWKIIWKTSFLIKWSSLLGKSYTTPFQSNLSQLEEESIAHLFLQCNLARAIWFEMDVNTRHLVDQNCSLQQWISQLCSNTADQDSIIETLPLVLTTIWCIQFHMNQVIFEGKYPNPTETILTAKSLLYRYREANQDALEPLRTHQIRNTNSRCFMTDWQVLVFVEGKSTKSGRWQGIGFFGKHREGDYIFVGCHNTRNRDINVTKAIAIRDAVLTAYGLGFRRVIVLTTAKNMELI